jgi:hypothetical protein
MPVAPFECGYCTGILDPSNSKQKTPKSSSIKSPPKKRKSDVLEKTPIKTPKSPKTLKKPLKVPTNALVKKKPIPIVPSPIQIQPKPDIIVTSPIASPNRAQRSQEYDQQLMNLFSGKHTIEDLDTSKGQPDVKSRELYNLSKNAAVVS